MTAGAAAALVVAATRVGLHAHKPVTSKYTFADVLPIVRRQCASCHAPGQVAPMSLLTYQDALPWAESIRQELLRESMPPWFTDPAGPPVTHSQSLTASELDTLVTWSAGGTPEGEPIAPAVDRPPPEWTAGTPDMIVEPAAASVLPPDVQEATREFELECPTAESRWVRAADFLPGDASMVRDATVAVRGGSTLLAWVPGEKPVDAAGHAVFRLPPHARLTLRVHYRKTWRDERAAKTERSRVGLYFDRAPAAGPELLQMPTGGTIAVPAAVVAVRPILDQPYASVEVRATTGSGPAVVLLRLHRPRPGWPRRYWLEKPIALPAGARLSIATVPALADPDETPVRGDGPLGAVVDFVAR